MWPFKSKEKNTKSLQLHEKYPEILQWQIGDELEYTAGLAYNLGTYQGVTDSGLIIFEDIFDKYHECDYRQLLNRTLRNKIIKMKTQGSYNSYLLEVQKAVKELQRGLS